MTATYTFDVFSTLDGFGSYNGGDWGGYWGKQGPELLEHRLASYSEEQRMVLGANTYRQFVAAAGPEHRGVRAGPWSRPDEDACRRRWCRRRWKDPSTGRTRPS